MLFSTLPRLSLWLKVPLVSLVLSLSVTFSKSLMPLFRETDSTFTARPPIPAPTPATVEFMARSVAVFTDKPSLAFSVLLFITVLTVSFRVFTSTPTPTPASRPAPPVPVASLIFSLLDVPMPIVSPCRELPTMLVITDVSILLTAALPATPALNRPPATPTDTSRDSSVVLLDASALSLDFAVSDFSSLFCTLARTEESSFTTPTPTFREPAPFNERVRPASMFRL